MKTVSLLSVIVPAFNEAGTLNELLRGVSAAAPPGKQVIVVDDGSSDGTQRVLESWKTMGRIQVVIHARNLGKGRAIRSALEHAQGRFTVIQDADREYDPADYERLLEPVLSGEVDVTYGSRYLSASGRGAHRWRLHRNGVRVFNMAVWWLYGQSLTDEATCYKLFPTDVLCAMDLQCERFEFCAEVTAKACRMGLRIREVPIHYSPRGLRAGKKIRLRDGWATLYELWRWRKWSASQCPLQPGE